MTTISTIEANLDRGVDAILTSLIVDHQMTLAQAKKAWKGYKEDNPEYEAGRATTFKDLF